MSLKTLIPQQARIVIAGVVGVGALVAFSLPGGADAADRSFPVSGFDRVDVAGSDTVIIKTGPAFSVVANGPDRDLQRLDVRVDGKTLNISRKSGWHFGWSNEDTTITVTMPAIKAVSAAGSSDVHVDKVSGDSFDLAVVGSGNARVDSVDVDKLAVRVAGSADARLAGRCTSLTLKVAGSGDAEMSKLACTDATVSVAGSGDADVKASHTAVVNVAGSGDVKVTGGATCKTSTSGSGDVDCN